MLSICKSHNTQFHFVVFSMHANVFVFRKEVDNSPFFFVSRKKEQRRKCVVYKVIFPALPERTEIMM